MVNNYLPRLRSRVRLEAWTTSSRHSRKFPNFNFFNTSVCHVISQHRNRLCRQKGQSWTKKQPSWVDLAASFFFSFFAPSLIEDRAATSKFRTKTEKIEPVNPVWKWRWNPVAKAERLTGDAEREIQRLETISWERQVKKPKKTKKKIETWQQFQWDKKCNFPKILLYIK